MSDIISKICVRRSTVGGDGFEVSFYRNGRYQPPRQFNTLKEAIEDARYLQNPQREERRRTEVCVDNGWPRRTHTLPQKDLEIVQRTADMSTRAADVCRSHGWEVGTYLRKGQAVMRITAIGEQSILTIYERFFHGQKGPETEVQFGGLPSDWEFFDPRSDWW